MRTSNDVARERLTEKSVDALPAPASGNRIYWDTPNAKGKDWTPGFGLRVTARGARAFILNYRTRTGRERRLTIGSVPAWSLMAAREEAAALKRRVDIGEDPLGQRHEQRDAPTMGELCDRFVVEHMTKKRDSTKRCYEAAVREVRKALGTRKVAEVSTDEVERLHRTITARAPFVANRTAAVMSKMFNMAIRSNWCLNNPVKGLDRNQENKRERYLTASELGRLTAALAAAEDRQAANVFTFLLLTGARVGEALSARWKDFDFDARRWTKPSAHTKTKRTHVVPLSAESIKLLISIKPDLIAEFGWVFPGRVAREHRVNVKDAWADICRAASIAGLRIHDLRHSYASALAGGGVSLPIIGALLGHTQAQTTHRYAHLLDDPLRQATNHVGSLIANAGRGSKARKSE
jgi:integrase